MPSNAEEPEKQYPVSLFLPESFARKLITALHLARTVSDSWGDVVRLPQGRLAVAVIAELQKSAPELFEAPETATRREEKGKGHA